MNEVRTLHDEAMAFAEKASIARIENNLEKASQMLRLAYESEKKAAMFLLDIASPEPTRSVLFRSAASLAIQLNEYREAEKLISAGLSGNTPSDIAEELRDLFENVSFQRHLSQKGITLEPEELQMSIAGKSVSAGMAPSEQLITRIENARKLIMRTIERLMRKPYRESGTISGELREYGLYVSALQAGSFTVSLKISRPKQPLPGFEKEFNYIHSENIIDEVMSCLDIFNKSQEQELRQKISEEAYYRNFIGIAKNLSPDGNEVRQVGFTAVRDGKEKRVNLTTAREEIRLVTRIPQKKPPTKEDRMATITGRLKYADGIIAEKQKIKLIDDEGIPHNIIVPEGMMSDIVKPLWDERVKVTGFYHYRAIALEDISKAPID